MRHIFESECLGRGNFLGGKEAIAASEGLVRAMERGEERRGEERRGEERRGGERGRDAGCLSHEGDDSPLSCPHTPSRQQGTAEGCVLLFGRDPSRLKPSQPAPRVTLLCLGKVMVGKSGDYLPERA
jgi:hypothetical protein